MRLSRPIVTCATESTHSLGVSPWLMPRSNRSICSGTCANRGSSASFRMTSRATSASRRSTTTPVRSAASIRACRSASRRRTGRLSAAALPPLFGASDMDGLSFSGFEVPLAYQLPHLPQSSNHSNDLYRAQLERQAAPPGKPDGAALSLDVSLTRREARQAVARFGSSTIEKRTAPRWRFSSETSRQQSSASLRVLNGPLTWAEPSTSLWKFIEPNSPPITQKLLPLIMRTSLLFSRLNLDFVAVRLEL